MQRNSLGVLSSPIAFFTALVILTMLLSSCSSQIKRVDGPPHFYVDETKIPNARPKPEKLAKIGNKPSYIVFGKRYHVMRSSKYYSAVGTASWYGTMFHKRKTSSGEPYNMLAMTAAHKSLPLPTYVEVTNLKNHRKVIVKVNDRGPFHSNRLIDLSYVAAKKLGMLGKGTALVKVKAIDPYAFGRHRHYVTASKHSTRYYAAKPRPKIALKTKSATRTNAQSLSQKSKMSSWQVVRNSAIAKAKKRRYLQVGEVKNKINQKKLR